MKRILFIISILYSFTLQGQGVFSIQSVPVCWTIGSIDSSLVANWLISANNPQPVVLSYLNGEGQAVSVSGGSVANGYCCCSGTGSSIIDSTRLTQDSILIYFQNGVEIGRDTISLSGTGGGGSGIIDSTRLTQDSILIYFQNGVEIGRDTIRLPDTGTTVTVTDNTDGTYTIIVDSDTTTIDTRANSNPITQTITIGGLTYNAGDFVENVLIGISNYINADVAGEICGDTLVQVSHGFSIGDLIGQGPGNGAYFAANTANPDSFPVAAVRKVLSVDTFIVCNEGFFSGFAHGKPLGRDYFLQDDGSVDTIPDADYNVFAFRTFKATKAYFDIPELIVSDTSATGGGGGSVNVTASNGLNDADAGADVDVELGGSLDKNTTITLGSNYLQAQGAGERLRVTGAGGGIEISPATATDASRPLGSFLYKNTAAGGTPKVSYSVYGLPTIQPLIANTHSYYMYNFDGTGYWLNAFSQGSGISSRDSSTFYTRYFLGGSILEDVEWNLNNGQYHFQIQDGFSTSSSDSVFIFRLAYDTAPYFQFEFDKDIGGGTMLRSDIRVNDTEIYLRYSLGANGTVFRITPYSVVIESPPEYANDAAADADSNLPSGGVYTLTGDRTMYIKP